MPIPRLHLAVLCALALAVPALAQRGGRAGPGVRPGGATVASHGVAAATAARAARMLRGGGRGGRGRIFVTPNAVSFNATDPASQPLVPGSASVAIRLMIFRPAANTNWTLSLAANAASFTGGPTGIPVSAVTWTSTGTVAGNNGTITTPNGSTALSATAATTASGTEGTGFLFSANVTCNLVFHDSWNYAPGTYSQTVTFTLATP